MSSYGFRGLYNKTDNEQDDGENFSTAHVGSKTCTGLDCLHLAVTESVARRVFPYFRASTDSPAAVLQQQHVVIQNTSQSIHITQSRQQQDETGTSEPGPAPGHRGRQEGDLEETGRLLLEAPQQRRQSRPGRR